jgi:hypothetical protein
MNKHTDTISNISSTFTPNLYNLHISLFDCLKGEAWTVRRQHGLLLVFYSGKNVKSHYLYDLIGTCHWHVPIRSYRQSLFDLLSARAARAVYGLFKEDLRSRVRRGGHTLKVSFRFFKLCNTVASMKHSHLLYSYNKP